MHGANKATERLKAVSLLFPGETAGWKFSKNPQKQVASLSPSVSLTHDHESSPLEPSGLRNLRILHCECGAFSALIKFHNA